MLLKTKLARNYGKGIVKWREEENGAWQTVAQWDDTAECLVLSGEAQKHEHAFLALMGKA